MIAGMPSVGRHEPVTSDLIADLGRFIPPAVQGRAAGVRISDLGGRRPSPSTTPAEVHVPTKDEILAYLRALEKTFLLALASIMGALIIITLTITDIYWFMRSGESLLHPWLDLFFLTAAVGTLVVATLSAITTKQYVKLTIRKMTEAC